MSEFSEDAANVLNDSVIGYYGDQATYYPANGNPIVLTGIYSSPNQREPSAYNGTFHDLFVRANDFPTAPVAGDMVEVFDWSWRVFDVTADFGGAYRLTLQRNLCR